jgi:aspartate racemase
MNDKFSGRFLGVLGGMGPLAGAFFVQRLIALTPSTRDQDHIPTILWSDPRIPDRPSGFLKQGEDPLPWLINGISELKRSGAKAIAIPCNTAHLWHRQMAAATDVPVLHIAQAVVEDLGRRRISTGKIGLMATAVTLRARLYQDLLEQHGFDCIVPAEDELELHCAKAIALVKVNRVDEAFEAAERCVDLLLRRGADAVVLGCTELPLALPHSRRAAMKIPILDSVDALALSALSWYLDGQAVCLGH